MSEQPPGRANGQDQQRPPRGRGQPIGQVQSLEEHVRPDWWGQIFNATYLKTDADVVEDPAITVAETDALIRALGLKPDHRILDLACGQGRHSIEMARRGFTAVEGLDRSHYLIQHARKDARAAGVQVRFREGDARKLPYPNDSFDRVILAGNSFGYFQSADDDQRVLREIARVLKPNGAFLIDVADARHLRRHLDPRSWEWIDTRQYVCRERSLSEDGSRLTTREIVADIDKGVIVDQFYSERLYDRDDLETALRNAGFKEIQFHGEHKPESAKNQDTGMMGHRVVMTGRIDKPWTPVKKPAGAGTRSVAVVLGDPRRQDLVKPGAVFDEDDYQTVDLLRSALSKLPEYRFTFLDNHDTLTRDLARRASSTDLALNLCDEGFRNDAHQELHVPALLEVAGVKYTGAGPQCLAYCYDKSLVRGAAREMGIPVAEGGFVDVGATTVDLPFGFPVIVKPNFGDSSMGITQKSVATNREELMAALAAVKQFVGSGRPVLVEQFLPGKDLSVGIIGNPPDGFHVLPITEEDYSAVPDDLPQICGYEAKWDPDSPYWGVRSVAAKISEAAETTMIQSCIRLFERLGCRDYARFDWRLDAHGTPRLLEANPNPGWCWDGHMAKMCHIAGITYPQMLGMILAAAEQRTGLRPPEPGRIHRPISSAPADLEALKAF
ncbi:MAG: methyltransferase domain-containing protein [Dehalococcoidia bacterium]